MPAQPRHAAAAAVDCAEPAAVALRRAQPQLRLAAGSLLLLAFIQGHGCAELHVAGGQRQPQGVLRGPQHGSAQPLLSQWSMSPQKVVGRLGVQRLTVAHTPEAHGVEGRCP